MRPFTYARAESVDQALDLLDGRSNNRQDGTQNGTQSSTSDGASAGDPPRLLAGGTDLITLMKPRVTTPIELIDIKRLDDLPKGIHETHGSQTGSQNGDQNGQSGPGLTLGALTSLSAIEESPLLQERYAALAQAAAGAATPQLRNMATLGGNLLQRPRCWYYRQEQFNCWLKGGDQCHAYDGENQHHALFGGGPCYAVHPSDLPAALLALDATVRLRGPSGERTAPLRDFYALPEAARRRENHLAHDEIILSVDLPALPPATRSLYLKAMDRKVWSFALVGVAAAVQIEDGKFAAARLVLSGVAPIPWRVPAAEDVLTGEAPSADLFDRAADAALDGAKPLAHNGYKVPLTRSLIRQALATLTHGHAA